MFHIKSGKAIAVTANSCLFKMWNLNEIHGLQFKHITLEFSIGDRHKAEVSF